MSGSKAKHTLIGLLKIGISAALIYFLISHAASEDEFVRFFETAKRWPWLVIGLLGCVAAFVTGFVRWHLLVRVLGLPFERFDAIRIGFIGAFFNLFTIGVIGGDALRAFYAARQAPSRKSEAIASVVFDRVIGILTMFTIAAAACSIVDFSKLQEKNETAFLAIRYVGVSSLVLAIVGYAMFAMVFVIPGLHRWAWFRWLSSVPRIGPIVRQVMSVILVYRGRPLAVAFSFLLSVLVNIFFAITIYAVGVGLNTPHPTLSEHLLIEPITMVSNALPLPGGIGGMEWVLELLYNLLASSSGVMVALVFRFFMLLVSAIGGIAWVISRESVARIEAVS